MGTVPFCHITLTTKKPPSDWIPAYPTNLETLGDHVLKHRLDQRLTARQAGQSIGVKEDVIYGWERGKSIPLAGIVPRIIDFLGYEPVYAEHKPVGGWIRASRLRLRLTQQQLAEQFGVCKFTIQYWEHDRSRPSRKLLEDLQAFFQVPQLINNMQA